MKNLSSGYFAKERRARNTLESVRNQLLSDRSYVDRYCQRFPVHTERFTDDFTSGFSGFQYSRYKEVIKLEKEQRSDIQTTVKMDVEAVGSFFTSVTGDA